MHLDEKKSATHLWFFSLIMSSDEDDYVCYGNALDPIDEDSIPRKQAITAKDQFAKDEHGRRRFHGAFTGGFSAGFYNSVGSREGWQPAHFISSRTNRIRSKDQTIFDFMDDEDTGEYGICPMSLQVKPVFDMNSSDTDPSNNKKRRRILNQDQHRALDTSFVREMLAPTRDTVGVMLLVKMGWKPGQGIGPRLSRMEKKRQTQQGQPKVAKKVYGCRLPTEASVSATDYELQASSSEPEFDGDFDNITFAPNDYQAYVVSPKQNAFGLGYQGIDRKPVLTSERSELSVLTVAGKSIRGQAFGVSVFEDDDDDIYSTEDMSNYDFSLPCVGEPKNTQQKSNSFKNTNCIEGFHVSTKSTSKTKQPFVLPHIPANFQPARLKKNRWDCTVATGTVRKMKVSSAPERLKLLEVGDVIAKDHDSNRDDRSVFRISDIPLPEQTTSTAPDPSNETVSANTSDMKPFAHDPQKQNRYENFLRLKNSSQILATDEISRIYPSNMTEWEKERERNEFEQAARLYRPLAEDLACRFTRGSQKENVHDFSTPVEKSYDAETQVLRSAAKSKTYGVLTRKNYPWKPDKVICKRFNVPEPLDDGSCHVSASVSNQHNRKGSLFEFLKMSSGNACVSRVTDAKVTSAPVIPPMLTQTSSPPLLQSETVRSECSIVEPPLSHEANASAVDEDSENDDRFEKITDKIDLFKAIFLSCSEDDDDDDRPITSSKEAEFSNATASPSRCDRSTDIETPTTTTQQADKKEIRYSPARGIFANLDLESLKCKPSFRKSDQSATTVTQAHRIIDSSCETNANVALLYGPKIPSSLLTKASTSTSENKRSAQCDFSAVQETRSCHSSSSVWVEKSDQRKIKKSKKYRKKQKKRKCRKEK